MPRPTWTAYNQQMTTYKARLMTLLPELTTSKPKYLAWKTIMFKIASIKLNKTVYLLVTDGESSNHQIMTSLSETQLAQATHLTGLHLEEEIPSVQQHEHDKLINDLI